MFDNYAYFDPAVFPRVIRDPHPNWRNITGYDPDYLVISSGIYDPSISSRWWKPNRSMMTIRMPTRCAYTKTIC